MRLMISFAALFLSVVLLQISTGGVGPLDALSGFALNFSSTEIGLLGSAHFLVFLLVVGTPLELWGQWDIQGHLLLLQRPAPSD